MLQIKTFSLPAEEAAANEFLKLHKPLGNIEYNASQIFIGYDDGEVSIAHEISDFQDMLTSQRNARVQQEIALHVMKWQLADTDTNTARWDEINTNIQAQQAALDLQDAKTAFVQKKIDELRAKQ